jgi:chitodextrinase
MTLYELDNYAGAALVKNVGDDATLTDDPLGTGSWNDKASSIKVTTAGADTTAPSTPTALSTSNVTTTQITLSWTASTDNVGVTGYEMYRDGKLVTTVTSTNYTFTSLTAATTYTLGVKARDGSNNVSSLATKGATTAAVSGGNCGSSAWSSSTSYNKGSIVKETCTWSILCTSGDLNKTFAWRCDAVDVTHCSAYEPGAVNSNWSGIWTKLEECP